MAKPLVFGEPQPSVASERVAHSLAIDRDGRVAIVSRKGWPGLGGVVLGVPRSILRRFSPDGRLLDELTLSPDVDVLRL